MGRPERRHEEKEVSDRSSTYLQVAVFAVSFLLTLFFLDLKKKSPSLLLEGVIAFDSIYLLQFLPIFPMTRLKISPSFKVLSPLHHFAA